MSDITVIVEADDVTIVEVGEAGPVGPGVPAGGSTGTVLRKLTDDDYDTEWADDASQIELNAETDARIEADALLTPLTDPRLSDARTPVAHAVSHKSGGTDALKLNELAAPTATVSFNGQRATLLGDPIGDQDAATRAWVLAQLALLTSGAPGSLDSFLEAYNRFLADEDAVTALTTIVAGKQPSAAMLTALAALVTANNKGLYFTGPNAPALFDLTAAGRALLDDADAPAQLTTLGLSAYVKTLVAAVDAPALRGLLGAVSDAAYGAPWAGVVDVAPSKNATRAAIEALRAATVPVTVVNADTTGATDAAAAIRSAAASACAAGGGLFFPPGVYLLDSLDANSNFVTLTRGIPIYAHPGTVTLKIGTLVTAWRAIFGTVDDESAVDSTGLDIHDLIFDGNSSVNIVDVSNQASRRNVVNAWKGDDLRFHDNKIVNWDGHQVVLFDGRVQGMTNVRINNNTFENMGGPYYHDSSTVYVEAVHVRVFDNQATAVIIGATTASNVGCAWELHGQDIDCHDNVCENYQSGCNLISNYPTSPIGLPKDYKFHHNTVLNCGTGLNLYPLGTPAMTDIDISHNLFEMSVDQWPTAGGGLGSAPAARHCGIALIATNVHVQRCRIEDNDFVWKAYATVAGVQDNGIFWSRPTRALIAGDDEGISINGNRFHGCPSSAIYVQWYKKLLRWDVNDNRFYNVGQSKLGNTYQAGMLVSDCLGAALAVAIQDLRFDRNKIIDDQGSHSLSFPLFLAPGTVRSHASCGLTNGNALVLDASATQIDLFSAVTGANIPANTTVTAVDPGVSITLSHAPTATATQALTLTGIIGGTSNVEVAGNNQRVADAAVIPIVQVQTGQTLSRDKALASEFEINGLNKAFSNATFATFTATNCAYQRGARFSSNNQNDEVVFLLPTTLLEGTWALALTYRTTPSAGIATIAVSPDGTTWTDLGTIDQYSAGSVTDVRSELTGLVVAADMKYVRVKMATKNASSTRYDGTVGLLSGVRTGV